MKSLRMSVALAAVALVLAAVPALAAPTIGVYFDAAAAVQSRNVQPNTLFHVYVVLSNVNDTVDAVEYKLNLPASVVILSTQWPTSNAINFGSDANGVQVGVGECALVYDSLPGYETYQVADMTCMALAPFTATDITITKYLGGAFADQVNAPQYSDCNSNLTEMAVSNGSLSSAVPAASASWGSVKAVFE